MDQSKIVKQLMTNKNYDETLEQIAQEIENQENDLKIQITRNHEDIIKNCASIGDFECHDGLESVTQKLNDFAVSICLNQKELQENEGVAEKCSAIHTLLESLKSILEKATSDNENIQNFQDYNEIQRTVKIFKKCVFYDKLKILVNNKRTNITNSLKQQCSIWLGEMLKLYDEFGNKVINKNDITRDELMLTDILSSLYIFRKMEAEDEFFDFFNAKRNKMSDHLKIYEMIGFLYVEKKLCEIDKRFELKRMNVNFDKEELIVLVKYVKMFGFNYKDADAKLEKICCDYIIDNRENINSKDDVDLFVNRGQEFLENVNNSAVIEFYYKVVDDAILKYYTEPEIEDKIKQVHQFRRSDYKFKALDKIKQMRENEYQKIDNIFDQERYKDLKSIVIDDEIVKYIKRKFTQKIKDSNEQKGKLVQAEEVKFYAFLKSYKKEAADLFYQ